jgi:deazaflavin-dependent oxidoreductase (nitroreductase family)
MLRRFFHFLNKFFMVPMFRLGFGPFFGNPFSGYIMVLKTVGRKSGRVRYAPVNYALRDGRVYCLAGFGQATDWLRNLQAEPRVEAILPGGAVAGRAALVADPAERLALVRQVLKNGGFAGFMEGFNPFTVPDEELERGTAAMPLVCIQPAGPGSGASDPAGWAWVWTVVFIVALILILWLR